MKAILINRAGTPVSSNIGVVNDWPEPIAGAGEVVIKTEAAALNHLDLWVGQGLPGLDLSYPRISGSDGAGVIESAGKGVDPGWIGRRVLLNAAVPIPQPPHPASRPVPDEISMIGEHTHGTLAEKFIAPVSNVVDISDSDPVEAAAFGLTHLTAWRMLWTRARVQPGQWVLITGIGGGVALAALNIAQHLGCSTIVTSRHQDKLDRAMALGATHGVLDTGEDWSRQVRALTGKRGVDVCIDSIGKAVHLWALKCLARGGAFITCGTTSGSDPPTDLARIFWNQLSVIGSTMGDMDEFRQIVALFRSGAIKPVIDSVFEPGQAQQAFARLESAEQFGKIVVRWTH